MELFLIIPLVLVAAAVVLAPILDLTIAEPRTRSRPSPSGRTRIPWNLGGPQPVDLPDDAAARRERARVG